jgi:hypothetical protein
MAQLDAQHPILSNDPTIQALRDEEPLSAVDPVGVSI